MMEPRKFFETGTPEQFQYALSKYQDALRLKAEQKNKKCDELIKLDKWYQEELPKALKKRGTDVFMNYEELVKLIKWKLIRGKFRPKLKELVQMNTPRMVKLETKKAFRALYKKEDISSALQALCNLKGVGPVMASAVLAAVAPDRVPYMADECLLTVPGIDGLDYTLKEYLIYMEKMNILCARLNSAEAVKTTSSSESTEAVNDASPKKWTPHTAELALWSHFMFHECKPGHLQKMFESRHENGEMNGTADSSPSSKGSDDAIASVVEDNENSNVTTEDSQDSVGEHSTVSSAEENGEEGNNNNNSNGTHLEEDSNLSSIGGGYDADSSSRMSAGDELDDEGSNMSSNSAAAAVNNRKRGNAENGEICIPLQPLDPQQQQQQTVALNLSENHNNHHHGDDDHKDENHHLLPPAPKMARLEEPKTEDAIATPQPPSATMTTTPPATPPPATTNATCINEELNKSNKPEEIASCT